VPTVEQLEAAIEKRICIRCGEQPRVVWGGSFGIQAKIYRCGCWKTLDGGSVQPVEPVLGERETQKKFIARRLGRMVDQSLATRPDRLPLSLAEIKDYISPLATEQEAFVFLRFCQAQGLNPFVGEAYLVKYDKTSPAAFVVGIQAYLKRAAGDDSYQGYDAGIIVVDKNDGVVERDGEFQHPGDKLVGGWALIEMTNRVRPLKVSVNLAEYHTGKSTWNKMPSTMIVKVALVQGLRRAIPAVEEMHQVAGGIDIVVDEMPPPANEVSPPAGAQQQPSPDSRPESQSDEPVSVEDWLQTCPVHKQPWRDAKFGPFHSTSDGKGCGAKQVLSPLVVERIDAMADAIGFSKADTNDWFKQSYEGRTRSKLTVSEQVEAIAKFGEFVTQFSAMEEPGEAEEDDGDEDAEALASSKQAKDTADLFGSEAEKVEADA